MHRLVSQVIMGTPINDTSINANIVNNIVHPFNYLIERPHARYRTLAVIKMKAGRETGALYMGHTHWTLGDDAATGVHLGKLNYYAKAVIEKGANIFIAHAVFISGYDGGLGSTFYKRGEKTYNPRMDKYNDDSIFVICLPRSERPKQNPISITGSFQWLSQELFDIEENRLGQLHYSQAVWYNRYWGWKQMALNQGLDDEMYNMFVNERSSPNAVTFASTAFYYNPNTRVHDFATNPTGHWKKEFIGAGKAGARHGETRVVSPISIIDNMHIINP